MDLETQPRLSPLSLGEIEQDIAKAQDLIKILSLAILILEKRGREK